MSRMQYTCSVAMSPVEQLVELVKTAEEVGFDSIALPDSIFHMEKQSADYPYTTEVALTRAARVGDGWTSAMMTCDQLAETIGKLDNIVIPWIFDGLGFDAPIDKKKDSLNRFSDIYIHSGWQK